MFNQPVQREQGGWREWICVLATYLSDFLYLGPSLPNERATLAGRDDQPQGDRWFGADGTIGHQCSQVLQEKIRQQGVKLEIKLDIIH